MIVQTTSRLKLQIEFFDLTLQLFCNYFNIFIITLSYYLSSAKWIQTSSNKKLLKKNNKNIYNNMYRQNLVQLLNRIIKLGGFSSDCCCTLLLLKAEKIYYIAIALFYTKKLLISGVLTCNTCPFYVIFHLINACVHV